MSRNLIGKKQNQFTQTGSVVSVSWLDAASGLFKTTVHVLDPVCISSCLPSRAWVLRLSFPGVSEEQG